ncbi:hypothetical protein ACFSM5_20045 [Lacibacterium aquatile]|uniref:Pyridoxamine 5'-phosphate oxidase n=1 Tax=Lacibacterium aquatile TaxID=1168082 RepID=A0ABW5DWG7_9PROT
MFDKEIAALMESAVMMIIATRNDAQRAAIGRAVGARLIDGGAFVDIYISGTQWSEAVSNCAPGVPVAFTFCRPTDYRTFQVKGAVVDVAVPDSADIATAGRYITGMGTVMLGLGVTQQQFHHWCTAEGLVRIRLKPHAIFQQTPGPGAGQQIAGGPA